MSHLSHRLAEAANSIRDLNEAPKVSPQEDEFLTDLTKAQIAAISPLMKSKDWNRLKAYLVSQKMVDKDFNDIKGYKMDRDVLSVLQRSFKDYHEQTENNITNSLTESTIEFMLDKKVVLRKTMKDGEARRAGDRWTKSGVLPYQFNKAAAEKYRIPWKTPLVDGGVTWGPGYKKGQKRDAVIGAKKSFEAVENGEGVTEGALNTMQKKLPAGVSLGKIIAGTQEWRGVGRNTNTKQSVVTLSAEIKKIGHMVGNPDPKTIDMIAKALIMHSKEQLTKKESVAEAVRLGKGRPAGAMTPAALFMHKFNQLEDDNAHGAAALLLAKFMGQPKAVKCIELVNRIHEIEGSIPYPIQQYRDQWSQRLWADFDKKYPKERFQ